MPNSYFRFKQFTILQDCCAMKVGTDGVLLGTWVDITNRSQILDIGTGTGLLALIMAQRALPACIDALEIDESAYLQATDNIKRSPWSDRIQVHHTSVQTYAASCVKRYDLIIVNPPFFENACKATQPNRNLARHSDSLSQIDLLKVVEKLLSPEGRLAIIYPTESATKFEIMAKDFNLFCDRKLYVKPIPNIPIKRVLMELSRDKSVCQETILTIEVSKHVYTSEYMALIKDFYLNA